MLYPKPSFDISGILTFIFKLIKNYPQATTQSLLVVFLLSSWLVFFSSDLWLTVLLLLAGLKFLVGLKERTMSSNAVFLSFFHPEQERTIYGLISPSENHVTQSHCSATSHKIDGKYNMYENEGGKCMQSFSGSAGGWKRCCAVHHFIWISHFQDIDSKITAVVVFNVPVLGFQGLKKNDLKPEKQDWLIWTYAVVWPKKKTARK